MLSPPLAPGGARRELRIEDLIVAPVAATAAEIRSERVRDCYAHRKTVARTTQPEAYRRLEVQPFPQPRRQREAQAEDVDPSGRPVVEERRAVERAGRGRADRQRVVERQAVTDGHVVSVLPTHS